MMTVSRCTSSPRLRPATAVAAASTLVPVAEAPVGGRRRRRRPQPLLQRLRRPPRAFAVTRHTSATGVIAKQPSAQDRDCDSTRRFAVRVARRTWVSAHSGFEYETGRQEHAVNIVSCFQIITNQWPLATSRTELLQVFHLQQGVRHDKGLGSPSDRVASRDGNRQQSVCRGHPWRLMDKRTQMIMMTHSGIEAGYRMRHRAPVSCPLLSHETRNHSREHRPTALCASCTKWDAEGRPLPSTVPR